MAATITLDLAGLTAEISKLITDKVDVGTTNLAGKLRIRSGAATLLVEVDLVDPAFVVGAGSIRTLDSTPLQGTAVANGTGATAQVLDRDENIVFSGPVTVVGGNGFIQLDKVDIEIGDVVTVLSGSIQYP